MTTESFTTGFFIDKVSEEYGLENACGPISYSMQEPVLPFASLVFAEGEAQTPPFSIDIDVSKQAKP